MSCHQLVVSKPRQCLGFAFEIGAIWWCFGCLPLACKCQLGTCTPSGNFLKQSMATRGSSKQAFCEANDLRSACVYWQLMLIAFFASLIWRSKRRGSLQRPQQCRLLAKCGRSAKGCLTVCLFFSIIFGYTGEYDTKIIAYTWAWVTWL